METYEFPYLRNSYSWTRNSTPFFTESLSHLRWIKYNSDVYNDEVRVRWEKSRPARLKINQKLPSTAVAVFREFPILTSSEGYKLVDIFDPVTRVHTQEPKNMLNFTYRYIFIYDVLFSTIVL